jgi:hypothetical protein
MDVVLSTLIYESFDRFISIMGMFHSSNCCELIFKCLWFMCEYERKGYSFDSFGV